MIQFFLFLFLCIGLGKNHQVLKYLFNHYTVYISLYRYIYKKYICANLYVKQFLKIRPYFQVRKEPTVLINSCGACWLWKHLDTLGLSVKHYERAKIFQIIWRTHFHREIFHLLTKFLSCDWKDIIIIFSL